MRAAWAGVCRRYVLCTGAPLASSHACGAPRCALHCPTAGMLGSGPLQAHLAASSHTHTLCAGWITRCRQGMRRPQVHSLAQRRADAERVQAAQRDGEGGATPTGAARRHSCLAARQHAGGGGGASGPHLVYHSSWHQVVQVARVLCQHRQPVCRPGGQALPADVQLVREPRQLCGTEAQSATACAARYASQAGFCSRLCCRRQLRHLLWRRGLGHQSQLYRAQRSEAHSHARAPGLGAVVGRSPGWPASSFSSCRACLGVATQSTTGGMDASFMITSTSSSSSWGATSWSSLRAAPPPYRTHGRQPWLCTCAETGTGLPRSAGPPGPSSSLGRMRTGWRLCMRGRLCWLLPHGSAARARGAPSGST